MTPNSITENCSAFISESPVVALYKTLPKAGDGFRKIKVRKKNKYDYNYERFLDDSFKHERQDLRLRSVLAHTRQPEAISDGEELFYIFPPNGYRLLFSENANNHREYLNILTKTIAESPTVDLLLKSVFQSAYRTGTLQEAAKTKSDVVIYNIQYYYAIRKSLISNYCDFITT